MDERSIAVRKWRAWTHSIPGRRSIRSLLVEGGGRMLASFVAAAAWDRWYWFQAPVLLGDGTPVLPGLAWPTVAQSPRLQVELRISVGDDDLRVLRGSEAQLEAVRRHDELVHVARRGVVTRLDVRGPGVHRRSGRRRRRQRHRRGHHRAGGRGRVMSFIGGTINKATELTGIHSLFGTDRRAELRQEYGLPANFGQGQKTSTLIAQAGFSSFDAEYQRTAESVALMDATERETGGKLAGRSGPDPERQQQQMAEDMRRMRELMEEQRSNNRPSLR